MSGEPWRDPDLAHRREYESVRDAHPAELPEWTALTEDQRQKVRDANQWKWEFFRDLGEKLRSEP